MPVERRLVIHEVALDTMSREFNKVGKKLCIEIRKDTLIIHEEYSSDLYSLFKFHGTTYGVKNKDSLPAQIQFTIGVDEYSIELNMRGEGQLNIVTFREKANSENFIYLKVT